MKNEKEVLRDIFNEILDLNWNILASWKLKDKLIILESNDIMRWVFGFISYNHEGTFTFGGGVWDNTDKEFNQLFELILRITKNYGYSLIINKT